MRIVIVAVVDRIELERIWIILIRNPDPDTQSEYEFLLVQTLYHSVSCRIVSQFITLNILSSIYVVSY